MQKLINNKLDNRSKYLRYLAVKGLDGGKRGHLGSAFSLIEVLRVLYDKVLKIDPENPNNINRDRCILSKGHGCLALYSILADKEFFKMSEKKIVSLFEKQKKNSLLFLSAVLLGIGITSRMNFVFIFSIKLCSYFTIRRFKGHRKMIG